jgi:hypothetical protein
VAVYRGGGTRAAARGLSVTWSVAWLGKRHFRPALTFLADASVVWLQRSADTRIGFDS